MTTKTPVQSVFAPRVVSVQFDQPFTPSEFFVNRPGLWVSDDFNKNLVVTKAEPTPAGKAFTVGLRILGRMAFDNEIEAEFGGQHLFTETHVTAIVGGLIAKQEGGKIGALLNSGYANLFYTRSCVVNVYWYAGYGGEWHVGAWQRDDRMWDAGGQMFSLATED